MNEAQLERYSRQILLPNFDIDGQLKLASAKVMVIGMGGLGNIASSYLAATGVGALTLIDDDAVELSNLARQVVYRTEDVGIPKVLAAQHRLLSQNPDVAIHTIQRRLDKTTLENLIDEVDLVLDCTDNFTTRKIINQVCLQAKVDLVTAAAIRWQGQIQSFLFSHNTSCCYQCLYPELNDSMLNCSESGVISPVVGSIGVLQALDAVKILSQCGDVEHGKLRLFDGFQGQWREVRLSQDPECQVCANKE